MEAEKNIVQVYVDNELRRLGHTPILTFSLHSDWSSEKIIKMLTKRYVKGKAIFYYLNDEIEDQQEYDDDDVEDEFYRPDYEYKSEKVTDPTVMDVIVIANKML